MRTDSPWEVGIAYRLVRRKRAQLVREGAHSDGGSRESERRREGAARG